MQLSRTKERGLSLVELMVVVAIIGVLATLAVFMFRRTTAKAKATEVQVMFSEFKTRQEAHYIENSVYVSTGVNEGDMHPAAPGTPDAKNSVAPLPATWQTLKMQPKDNNLYCSYVSIAGTAATAPPAGTRAADDFDFDTAPGQDWYYLLAECDWDSDPGVNSFYFARSDSEGVAVRNEGR